MMTCKKGCCSYEVRDYKRCEFIPRSKNKAGVFIYDPKKEKVLLVQSRGNLWGPPKGSLESDETFLDCAIREVREETGIKLDNGNIGDNKKLIFDNSHYFYCELEQIPVTLDTPMTSSDINDASGIGWFSINCLVELVELNTIHINFHCKLLLEYFLKFKAINFSSQC